MGQPAKYLTPAELSKRWDGAVTVGTLANWRSKGKGPVYAKFGSSVRYPLSKVEAWEAQNLKGANDNEPETKTE